MVKKMTEREKLEMATRYRPLLVLYPEIEAGSQRKEHYHRGHRAGHPPLDQDYHPRDVRLALDNAALPPKFLPQFLPGFRARCWVKLRRYLPCLRSPQEELLEKMCSQKEKNKDVKNIDILPGTSPSKSGKFWHFYANVEDRDGKYPRKAYARFIPGVRRYADFVIIQYWMAYFFDDWANVHEMDWEMVSVALRRTEIEEYPVACIYRAHVGGFRAPWRDVEKADENKRRVKKGQHPIAYIANGSHASYFHDDPVHPALASMVGPRLGQLVSRFPWIRNNFSDYVPAFDEGEKHFPEIEVMPEPNKDGNWEGDWRWLNFTGRWGSKGRVSLTERLTLPLEEDGPPGLSKQGSCWEDPFHWVEEKCFSLEEKWLLECAEEAEEG